MKSQVNHTLILSYSYHNINVEVDRSICMMKKMKKQRVPQMMKKQRVPQYILVRQEPGILVGVGGFFCLIACVCGKACASEGLYIIACCACVGEFVLSHCTSFARAATVCVFVT